MPRLAPWAISSNDSMTGAAKNSTTTHFIGLISFHLRSAARHLTAIFENDLRRTAFINDIRGKTAPAIIDLPLNDSRYYTLQTLFDDVLKDIYTTKKSIKASGNLLLSVLYVCILDMLKDILVAEDFKYPTILSFTQVYGKIFPHESDKETELLWKTANWMVIFFRLVRAKANLGLTLDVIPKLLEGWSAKYITGGGSAAPTASRVFIFREEGNVPLIRRIKPAVQPEKKVVRFFF
jgi:hypothetical protein